MKLAGEDGLAREEMRRLYSLVFKDAPTLGSLIDPLRLEKSVYSAGAERVLPLIEEALAREQSEETRRAGHRRARRAGGVPDSGQPLHAGGDQCAVSRARQAGPRFSRSTAPSSTPTPRRTWPPVLSTGCLRFARDGGSVALVTPQNWLFLTSYKKAARAAAEGRAVGLRGAPG